MSAPEPRPAKLSSDRGWLYLHIRPVGRPDQTWNLNGWMWKVACHHVRRTLARDRRWSVRLCETPGPLFADPWSCAREWTVADRRVARRIRQAYVSAEDGQPADFYLGLVDRLVVSESEPRSADVASRASPAGRREGGAASKSRT